MLTRKKLFIFFMVLLAASISLAQQTEYKNEFNAYTDGLDFDYSTLQKIWDASFIRIDYSSGKGTDLNVKTHPMNNSPAGTALSIFPRPYKEKTALLEKLYSSIGSSSDIAIILCRIYNSAGENAKVDAILQKYIAASDNYKNYRKASAYYHSKIEIDKEIGLLLKAAELGDNSDSVSALSDALGLIGDYEIRTAERDGIYKKIIEKTDNPTHWLGKWFDFLEEEKKSSQLEQLISTYRKQIKNEEKFFNNREASLYFLLGKNDKAIQIFYKILDPADMNGGFNDYFETLERIGIFNQIRRDLFTKWKAGNASLLDKAVLQRMYIRGGNTGQAKTVLNDMAEVISKSGYKLADMKTLAVAMKLSFRYQDAMRIYWDLANMTTNKDESMRYLMEVEAILFDQSSLFSYFYRGGLEGWFKMPMINEFPSFFGGIASLLYNGSEFNMYADSLANVVATSRGRGSCLAMYEYAKKNHAGAELEQITLLDTAKIYYDYGLTDQAIKTALDFRKNHPSSKMNMRASEILLSCYSVKKDNNKILSTYTDILTWFDRNKDEVNYWDYFEKRHSWLVSIRDFTTAIKLYWDEINRRPGEVKLYENFLQFVERYNFDREELQIYEKALARFKDSTWVHKIARYYIRKKMWKSYTDFSEKIIKSFDDDKLQAYLTDFEPYVPGSSLSWRQTLYYKMYKYSLENYPLNSYYLQGLMNYYHRYGTSTDIYNLAKQYYFINQDCRRLVKGEMFKKTALDSSLLTAKIDAGNNAPANLVSMLLQGYSLEWFSYFEESEEVFHKLAEIYADNSYMLEKLASLYRSLGKTDDTVKAYTTLADRHPRNTSYMTLAGESLADRYVMELAAKYWDRILLINPKDEELSKEVASIFWDYYMFDHAAEILVNLRKKVKKPTLFAETLGAVYESAKKFDAAVAEYVNGISEVEYYFWDKVDRLYAIGKQRGKTEAIKNAFFKKAKEEPDNETLFKAAAYYFDKTSDDKSLVKLYQDTISNTKSLMLLSEMYYYFQGRDDQANMNRIMLRKLDVSEGQSWILDDTINYFEDIRDYAQAEKLIKRKMEMTAAEADEFPDKYLYALEEASRFYRRINKFDKAYEKMKAAIDFASGIRKSSLQVDLAKLYIAKNRYDDATVILKDLNRNYPNNIEYQNVLASIYTAKGDFNGLVDFYTEAIKNIKASSIHPITKKSSIAQLRYGLIEGYTKIKRYFEAVDQYIEIINQEPEDSIVVNKAYEYAEEHGQTKRIFDYYLKTSKTSFKDFKWQLVLARLYTASDELEKSVEQYNLAIKNEPQKIELYEELVEIYTRLNRFKDAADVYAEIYELSKQNSDYLLKQAEMLHRAGDGKTAIDIVLKMTKDKPADHNIYFKTAKVLKSWGEYDKALSEALEGLNKYKGNTGKDQLDYGDIELLSDIYLKRGKAMEAIDMLFSYYAWLDTEQAAADKRRDYNTRWYLERSMTSIRDVISNKLGKNVYNFAKDNDVMKLTEKLEKYYKGKSSEAMKSSILNFARAADIWKLEEAIQMYSKTSIWNAETYFKKRVDFDNLIKLFKSQSSSYRAEDYKKLAYLYRIQGDEKNELIYIKKYIESNNYGISDSERSFNEFNPILTRYFELALKDNKTPIKNYYSGHLSKYTGTLVNVLLKQKKYDQAIKILDENLLKRPKYWVLAKKAEILIHIKKFDPKLESEMRALLSIQPISNRLQTTKTESLKDSEWYAFAARYAEYLALKKDKQYHKLVISQIEELPKSEEKQILTGNIYLGIGDAVNAEKHYNLALQLSPKNKIALKMLGTALNKQGKTNQAFSVWEKLYESNLTNDYALYMNVLIENGYAEKGIKRYIAHIDDMVQKRSYTDNIFSVVTGAKKITELHKVQYDCTSIIRKIFENNRTSISLLRQIVSDTYLLNEKDKTYYYGELYTLTEESTSIPIDQKENTVRDYYDHLMKIDKFAEAKKLMAEQLSSDKNQVKLWIPVRLILVRAKLGEKPAITEIERKYITKNSTSAYREFIKALSDVKIADERNKLAIEMYKYLIDKQKQVNDSNLYGYANELFIAGNRDEAIKSINRLMTYTPNNTKALSLAADLLDKNKLYGKAIEARENIRKITPDDDANLCALAKLYVSNKQYSDSENLMIKILERNDVSRSVRNDLTEYILEKITHNLPPSGKIVKYVNTAIAQKPQIVDENYFIIAAYEAEMKRNPNRVKFLLTRASVTLAYASRADLRLSEYYRNIKDYEKAIKYSMKAINQSPDDNSLLRLLFETYFDKGEYLKAVKVLEPYENQESLSSGETRIIYEFKKVYTNLNSTKEKIEFIEKMKNAAIKIDSLSRLDFYHSLLFDLVKDNPVELAKWHKENNAIKEKISNRIKAEEKLFTLKWRI
ncbi:MAG: tetratricopeptide repeat protein [Acidobacteria bacterium]|nr:tetratricopeptide repeat protein [Acidobacteriota bacterium]